MTNFNFDYMYHQNQILSKKNHCSNPVSTTGLLENNMGAEW